MRMTRWLQVAFTPALIILSKHGPQQTPVRMQGTLVLSIGANESAPDEYQFAQIRATAIAPDGRLVVSDAGYKEIRVYDRAGRFQYNLLREGAGPGEIRSPAGIGFSQDGLFWVRDEGNARWSAFRLGERSASFVRIIRRPTRSMGDREPVTFDRAGLPIDITTPWTTDDLMPTVRLRVDTAGNVIARDTIRHPPRDSVDDVIVTKTDRDGSMTRTTVRPMFGSTLLLAHSPFGEYARVVTQSYDIDWRAEDGKRIRRIRRTTAPVPLSQDERAAYRQMFAGTGTSPRTPGTKAPIDNIVFDQEGRLWVVRPSREGTPREADVFDRSGRHVSVMVLPRFTEIGPATPIRNNTAIIRLFDTTGVTRVGLIRFR